MHRAVSGHGPPRGDQRLPGHLPAEHPLHPLVRAAAAEDVDLDLLQIQQIDQVVQSLAHDCATVPFRSPRNLDGILDGCARRARRRPGQGQPLPGPGHAHVEQPPLLGDRLTRLGIHDRQDSFSQTGQEHHIPLQALGSVQGRQRNAWRGGGFPAAARAASSAAKSASVAPGRPSEVLGQRGQSGQRLPALPGRTPAQRRGVGQPQAGQHVPDLGGQRGGRPAGPAGRPFRLLPAPPTTGRRPKQADGLPHLGPVEKPLGPPDLIGNASLPQRPLERLSLRVDPHQHGDLPRVDARRDERSCPPGDRVRLGLVVRVLGERRLRAGRPLRHQAGRPPGHRAARDARLPPAAAMSRLASAHHLRRGPVVADQPDHGGRRELGGETGQVARAGPR